VVVHECDRPIDSSIFRILLIGLIGFLVLVEKKFHIFIIRHVPKLDNIKQSLPKLEVEDP
jgi:hypothetical protein